jgi:hypothetical protein
MVLALMYHGRDKDLAKIFVQSSDNDKMRLSAFRRITRAPKVSLDDCADAMRQFLDNRLNERAGSTECESNSEDTVEVQEITDAAELWGEGLGTYLQLHHRPVFDALFAGSQVSDVVHTAVSPLIPYETTQVIQSNIRLQDNKYIIQVQRELRRSRDQWVEVMGRHTFSYKHKKAAGLSINPDRADFVDAYTWTVAPHGTSRAQWWREVRVRWYRLDRQSRLLGRMRDIFKALMQIPDKDKVGVKLMLPTPSCRDQGQAAAISALKFHRVAEDSHRISDIIQNLPTRVALDRAIKRIAENIADIQLMYRIFSTAHVSKGHFEEFPVVLDLSAGTTDTIQFPPMESDPLLGRIKAQDLQVIGQFLVEHRVELAHLGADALYVSMIEKTNEAGQLASGISCCAEGETDYASFMEVIIISHLSGRLALPLIKADSAGADAERARMQAMSDKAEEDAAQRRYYMECGLHESAAEICEQPYQIWAEFEGQPVRVLCSKDYRDDTSDPGQNVPASEPENTQGSGQDNTEGHTDKAAGHHEANGQPSDSNLDMVKGLVCDPMGIRNEANLCYLIAIVQVNPHI